MEKQKVGMKTSLACAEAVSYLKALAESLGTGRIVVENGENHITLTPPENVTIKIEAKIKKDKQKFSLELSWSDNTGAIMAISDKEPEAAKAAPVEEKKAEAPAPKKKEKKEAKPEKAKKEDKAKKKK